MKRHHLVTALGASLVFLLVLAAFSLPRDNEDSQGLKPQPTSQSVVRPDPPLDVIDFQNVLALKEQEQNLAIQQYVDAVRLSEYIASLPPPPPPFYVDEGHWAAINICEEGGTWNNDGWTSDGHFQGGLGMSVEAWNEVVSEAPQYGFSLPPSSNMATPYQQMQGAQILLNRVGPGGWACKA